MIELYINYDYNNNNTNGAVNHILICLRFFYMSDKTSQQMQKPPQSAQSVQEQRLAFHIIDTDFATEAKPPQSAHTQHLQHNHT